MILIVEDDVRLNQALCRLFAGAGYMVTGAHSIKEALLISGAALVIIDIGLPDGDGFALCRQIRRTGSTPVIFLTARDDERDMIQAFDCGADDYLVKPFAFEELLARIRCVSRRPGRLEQNQKLSFGDLVWDMGENRLQGPSGQCSLSKKEGTLLEIFLRNPSQILSRPILLSRVWGMEFEVEEGNLDNYIHFLRRRLKAVGSHTSIVTARGVGYRLDSQN